MTIIFKPTPGAKRWQPLQRRPSDGGAAPTLAVERNYTVILGSHCNSRLKFEKDGEERCLVANVPGAKLSAKDFGAYWINLDGGIITVGTGALCYR